MAWDWISTIIGVFWDKIKQYAFKKAKKFLFIWWVSVVIFLDISLLVYHILVSNGMYPPMVLFIIEVVLFIPIIIVAVLSGGKHGRLQNRTKKARKRKSYAGLESRTRF